MRSTTIPEKNSRFKVEQDRKSYLISIKMSDMTGGQARNTLLNNNKHLYRKMEIVCRNLTRLNENAIFVLFSKEMMTKLSWISSLKCL